MATPQTLVTEVSTEGVEDSQNAKQTDNTEEKTSKDEKKGQRIRIIDIDGDTETGDTESSQSTEFGEEAQIGAGLETPRITTKDNSSECQQTDYIIPTLETDNHSISQTDTCANEASNNSGNANQTEAVPLNESREDNSVSHQKADNTGVRERTTQQLELPGLVVKAKDDATMLYKLGRYAEAMEKYSEAIDVLWKGEGVPFQMHSI